MTETPQPARQSTVSAVRRDLNNLFENTPGFRAICYIGADRAFYGVEVWLPSSQGQPFWTHRFEGSMKSRDIVAEARVAVERLLPDPPKPKATRGTSNGNARGSAADRRRRRAWLMEAYASDVPGLVRCYRHGGFLYNPDDYPDHPSGSTRPDPEFIRKYGTRVWSARPLTIDRIIPGCKGGTYRRNNIRPACGDCNSETGGGLHAAPGKRKS